MLSVYGEKRGEQILKMNKISEIARFTGISVSTIKFYMSQGLLPKPVKSRPNVAYYGNEFAERLKVIKSMRDSGLSVKDIKAILARHPFENLSQWGEFLKHAKRSKSFELTPEQKIAVLSAEERRKEKILEAAFRVFSSKGFQNTTMDDIASTAGVSKGTCYQYFKSKEEIFIATIDATLERLLSQAEQAASKATDPLERLGLKGLTFITKYADLQMMIIGLFTEILGGNKKLKSKAKQVHEKVAEFLSKEIERGIREGKLRHIDSKSVAHALIGIAEAVGNRCLYEENFDPLVFLVNLMDFMEHGLTPESKWGKMPEGRLEAREKTLAPKGKEGKRQRQK